MEKSIQNKLRKSDIDKIVNTYINREEIDKYSHRASLEEIKENDYNLNIPRYVDTYEEEAEIDLAEVQQKIAQLQTELADVQKQMDEYLKLF